MKDIDFDELDRAVSSVLGQKSGTSDKTDDKSTEDTDNTSDVTTSSDVVVESDADKTEETQDESNNDATETAPDESSEVSEPEPTQTPQASPLAVKRRGQFMDVMHPSADMSTSNKPPVKPVRSIQPLSPLEPESKTEEPTPEKDDKETENSTPVVPSGEPTATVDESHALIGAEPLLLEAGDESESQPDENTDKAAPTDTSDESAAKDTPKLEVPESIDDAKESDEEVPSITAEPDETATTQPTPFLSDTKVDKRPLGAFGVDPDSAEPGAGSNSATSADTQTAPVVPLPRELQPDVVEVEAVQENEDDATVTPTTPFSKNVSPAPEPSNDDRVEGHPLFDTSTYHEPIVAIPSKSAPAWIKWLIGLLICLAIGAGVGYFLFSAGL